MSSSSSSSSSSHAAGPSSSSVAAAPGGSSSGRASGPSSSAAPGDAIADASSSSSSRPPRALYVGGLDESVTAATLQAAFIPFGELLEVQLPLDVVTQKSRGFGFVQFADEGDALDAMENMHQSELFGRVIKVSLSRPLKTKSAWADADEWYAKLKAEADAEGGGGDDEEVDERGGAGEGAAAAAPQGSAARAAEAGAR